MDEPYYHALILCFQHSDLEIIVHKFDINFEVHKKVQNVVTKKIQKVVCRQICFMTTAKCCKNVWFSKLVETLLWFLLLHPSSGACKMTLVFHLD